MKRFLLAALLLAGCAKHDAPASVGPMTNELKITAPVIAPVNDAYIRRLQHNLDRDQNRVNDEQAALDNAKAKRGKSIILTYTEIDILTQMLSQVTISQGTSATQCVPQEIDIIFTNGDKWHGQSSIDPGVAQHILHELGTDVDICK